MRYTTYYNVPVPTGTDAADVPTTVGATADALDTAMHQNVADANTAYAGAATKTYVDAAVANGAQPLPAVALRMVGTRISQIVETRADGTTDVSTISYSGDQLLTVAQGNPARTITFGYAGSAPTGWTVA